MHVRRWLLTLLRRPDRVPSSLQSERAHSQAAGLRAHGLSTGRLKSTLNIGLLLMGGMLAWA